MHALTIVGVALCAVGAVLHGYIFWLESIAWQRPRARRVFELDAEQARITAPLALNQGFYNLFLGVEVLVGALLLAAGAQVAGFTAIVIGAGSMVAAAVVLVVSDRGKARPAAVQAAAPLLGLLLLAAGALTG